jgi:hypothetical protein
MKKVSYVPDHIHLFWDVSNHDIAFQVSVAVAEMTKTKYLAKCIGTYELRLFEWPICVAGI